MNIEQKIIALDILRNPGAIATERGRKAAILEILGCGRLAARLIHVGDRIDFEISEIDRLSADEPLLLNIPEGHEPPADLVRAEKALIEKRDEMRALVAEIETLAAALESEINTIDRLAIARWQEGRIPA